jgi:hypothetical protein
MENREKLRVLLQHWIEHNGGHVAEFNKWRATMADEHQDRLVAALDRAAEQMDVVSETLQQALDELGGPAADHAHHHHHHHGDGHHHH